MDMSEFANSLDDLIRKYREAPFLTWEKLYADGDCLNDYALGSEDAPQWWQAHTDVLEIVTDPNGRKWVNVSIVLYPLWSRRVSHEYSATLASNHAG